LQRSGFVLTRNGFANREDGVLLYRRIPPYDMRTFPDPMVDPPWRPRGDLERFVADGTRRTLEELPVDVRRIAQCAADACAAESVCTAAWLYGSWAWGEPTSRSDVDICAIVDKGCKGRLLEVDQEIIRRYCDTPDVDVDELEKCHRLHLLVYTEDWFSAYPKESLGNSVQETIKKQGIQLYARQTAYA
jgi:predicted nucleotidyltransferase